MEQNFNGYTIKMAKGVNKAPRNPASCFFISCFTVSVTHSINRLESSCDFMILIISFISSLDINNVNTFPALTAPFPICLLDLKLNCLLIQVNCL